MAHTRDIDMLHGGLWKKILCFTIPLMLSGLLQTVYNAADMVVVGKFVGDDALAAVGATSALYNIVVNLFMGLSVGIDVLSARLHGCGDERGVRETVDTAVISSLVIGLAVAALGVSITGPVLQWMGTPTENGVYEGAVTYLTIVFSGIPFTMIYNFLSAILRTQGDTRAPFLYLTIAGLLNIGLNVLFVAAFGMGVSGVAWATLISQALSAVLVFLRLWRSTGLFSFRFRGAHFSFRRFRSIFAIGILAGIQNAIFSFSNAFMQAGVNSLGNTVMAGSTAAETVENFLWMTASAFQYAAATFISKNAAAGYMDRVRRVFYITTLAGGAIGLVLGVGAYLTGPQLFTLFLDGEGDALPYAMQRAAVTYPFYFLAAIMGTVPSAIRGLGHSVSPTVITISGVCVLRVLWCYTVFAAHPRLNVLYTVHPITWGITVAALLVAYGFYYRAACRALRDPAPALL